MGAFNKRKRQHLLFYHSKINVMKELQILLVEDNEGDILLTREAFKTSRLPYSIDIAKDGELALNMLFQEQMYENYALPDIILLDINLPKINGLEVLAKIKKSEKLRVIPVIVFTTSEAEKDIADSYSHYANSYIVKPATIDTFSNIVNCLESYWGETVQLAGAK